MATLLFAYNHHFQLRRQAPLFMIIVCITFIQQSSLTPVISSVDKFDFFDPFHTTKVYCPPRPALVSSMCAGAGSIITVQNTINSQKRIPTTVPAGLECGLIQSKIHWNRKRNANTSCKNHLNPFFFVLALFW